MRNTHRWAAGGVECFRLAGGEIAVAVAGRRHLPSGSTVRVRDRENRIHDWPRDQLHWFCTVRAR